MTVSSNRWLVLGLCCLSAGQTYAEIPVHTGLPELSKRRAHIALAADQRAIDNAKAEQAKAQAAQEKAKAEKAKAQQAAQDQAKAEKAKAQAAQDQAKAEQTKTQQAAQEKAKAEKAKAQQAAQDQAKAERAKAQAAQEKAKAEKAKAQQAAQDQAKAERAKAQAAQEKAKAEKAKAQQAAQDQAKAEQPAKAKQSSTTRTDLASLLKAQGIKSRWVKLSAQGKILPDHAKTWSCVYDQQRRLIWEEKSDHGLHAAQDRYVIDLQALGEASVRCHGSVGSCTVTRYMAALRQRQHCGVRGWQLPTLTELESLKGGSAKPAEGTMIYTATRYFEYWPQRAIYWSSHRVDIGGIATSVYYAVDFNNNTSPIFDAKDSALAVRAVAREPQGKR